MTVTAVKPVTVTPLDRTARRCLTSRKGRPIPVHETSLDGLWTYEWREDETGTPWQVTYLPTGQWQWFTSRDAGRRWTATPGALAFLQAEAVETLTGQYAPADQRRTAVKALATLRGYLPAGTDVDTLCRCGGYLTTLAYGVVHVDTCQECQAGSGLCDQPHKVCDQPSPVQCDHPRCRHPHRVDGRDCDMGHEACCGCCHRGH